MVPVLPTETLILILIGLIIILAGLIINLSLKFRRFTAGKNGASLESAIVDLTKGLKEEQEFKREMENYLTEVERRLIRGIRSVEIIRFNAFKGTGSGGNQSFAVSLVNEKGDGLMLSSLHARDRLSVFAKPVKSWKTELELSPEEQEALAKSKASIEAIPHSS